VTFTITARADPNFDGSFDITNVATLTLGANTHCEPTDTGESCDAAAVFRLPVSVPVPKTTAASPPLASTGVDVTSGVGVGLLLLGCGAAMTDDHPPPPVDPAVVTNPVGVT
jgi:hypothetical protein